MFLNPWNSTKEDNEGDEYDISKDDRDGMLYWWECECVYLFVSKIMLKFFVWLQHHRSKKSKNDEH